MTLAEEIATQRRKVDFDNYDLSVQQLLIMVKDNTINIAPEYQRHFRWDPDRQSQLVESVFLGIPIPPMFMATNLDSSWEVVDGVQRLSTLIHFAGDSASRKLIDLEDPLLLNNLEKLPSLNGKIFDELPHTVQVQFFLRPIKVVTLSDKSDSVVRFDLFERLNTGGVALSDQEIRACVFRGRFNDFVCDLAKDPDFMKVVTLPPKRRDDRYDEECVLRFFAFLHRYRTFEHSVVGFLNEFMETASVSFDYSLNRELFKETFRGLARLFPNGITRQGRKSTPINLFEGVAVGAGLAVQQNGNLPSLRNLNWIDSNDLKTFTAGATNTQRMVAGRIEFCAKKFRWSEAG